jgi:Chaperone of endosialidase
MSATSSLGGSGSGGVSEVYELSTTSIHTVGATATVTDLAPATTSVVLPSVSPANRVITVRNPNPAVVVSSPYKNMQGLVVTSVVENTSVTLISTGTEWVEFSDADFADRWAWGTPTTPTESTTVNTGRTGNTAFGFNNPLHTADVGGSLGLNLAKVNTPTTTIASGAGSPTVVYLNSVNPQTVTLASTAQTRRVLYFVNNTAAAKVVSPYLGLDGTTRTDIPPFSGLMLQNALTEWREVLSTKLPPTFDATVSFSTATPTTAGVVFTPNTPASTTVLYVSSIDGSQWTYNGTTYVTAPISSDWKITGNAGTVQATNFVGTTDNVGLSFRTANVIRQTITNAGNVGIGTTAPLFKLSNTASTILDGGPGLGTGTAVSGIGWSIAEAGYAVGIENIATNAYSNGLTVRTASADPLTSILSVGSSNTRRMVVQGNGNVGIGTPTPATLFHVNGTATFAGGATISGTGSSTWIAMPSGGSGIGTTNATWAANVVGASNYFTGSLPGDTAYRNLTGKLLFGNTSGAPAMAITGNNVGIGTLAPTQKLHVIGNILASGTITPSDKRLKSNIKDVQYGVKELLKLKPVSYTKKFSLDKDEKGEIKEFGFIAQDLQKVIPELVTENGADKLLAINYMSLIPLLVKAIQEQQQQIEVLKAKVK